MNQKKLLGLLLALVLAFSLVSTAFAVDAEKTFSDVGDSHWAKSFIDRLVESGAAEGYPDGTFKPDQNITRVEFMKLLNQVAGFTAKADVTKFTDVSAEWKLEAVSVALAAGYTTGTTATTMSPNANITREMAVTMIGRAAQLDAKNADAAALEKYSDKDAVAAYAAGYMAEMTQRELLAGYPDGTVKPQGLLTRAEAAKLLCGCMDLLTEDTVTVLMNIPYDDFYGQVLGMGSVKIDAVTAATTKNDSVSKKAVIFWDGTEKGNTPVAYGEGSTLKGVQFPVQIKESALAKLTGLKETDDYYIYDTEVKDPVLSAKATVAADGSVSFSGMKYAITELKDATVTIQTDSKHGQYLLEIGNDDGVLTEADKATFQVYGVVLQDSEGNAYPTYHLLNLYYKDFHEIAFNTTADTTEKGQESWKNYKDAFAGLEGKTISQITYYTNAGVYSIAANAVVAPATYVLMNIPYADFYAAENAVDNISAATLNGKARNVNVNGASYHQSEAAVSTEGIAGVTFPVKIVGSDAIAALAKLTEVTDETVVAYELSARGQTTPVELKGAAALAEQPSYSYYKLSDAPAGYKTLTLDKDGKFVFSAVQGNAAAASAEGTVAYNGHADVEISLSGVEVEASDVSGVIVTTTSGSYALHHVVNIWRGTEIGWNGDDLDLYGQTVTNVRYFLKDGTVTDYAVNIAVKNAAGDKVAAAFADAKTIAVTDLPTDIANPVATVESVVPRGETPVVIAENVKVADGKIVASEAAVDGTSYAITIVSDNYADVALTIGYTAP